MWVLFLITFLSTFNLTCQDSTNLSFSVAAEQFKVMNIVLYVVNAKAERSCDINSLANVVKKDLEFTKQFEITLKEVSSLPTKSEIIALSEQAIPFIIFVTNSAQGFEWRLYDTSQIAMIAGKKMPLEENNRLVAHRTADAIWYELTGKKGFFSTKIAYCKDRTYKGKIIKTIHIADYDGSYEQCVVDAPTLHLAPRWNNDGDNPLLFFSESTNTNMRLASIDFKGHKKIASNFEGLNMLPSFSSDGKSVVYAASRGTGNCQLYYYKKGYFKRLTHNMGNNVSPIFINDTTIAFCSDFAEGKPYLYTYDLTTGHMELLAKGYCCTPTYNDQQKLLAYGKMVKGTLQLFTYNMNTKVHTQITFDNANKEECSWSPCGTFLIFASEHKNISRIALLNANTDQIIYLTDQKDKCSYPTWSGAYRSIPAIWL